jgi:hypothetical protein
MSAVSHIGAVRSSGNASVTDLFGNADLVAAVDEHTRGLLGRARRARRGWLLRRSLLLADLLGLALAYLLAAVLVGGHMSATLGSPSALALFIVTLPCWVVVAKLQGLYDRDEERANHSTSDEIVGVFQLVTMGVWLLLVGAYLTGLVAPDIGNVATFWALAVGSRRPHRRASSVPAQSCVPAEHRDRRCRRRRPADRAKAHQASRVRDQRRGVRR